MLSLHAKIAVLTTIPLLLWGAYALSQRGEQVKHFDDVIMGVQHANPASVTVTHSLGGREHLVDITSESEDVTLISLPESWERDEVRNAPLASVKAEEPSLGYRRWLLPAHAGVTFKTQDDWQSLTLHNASPSTLKVRVITVDLQKNSSETEVYLVKQVPLTVTFPHSAQ